MKSSPQFDPDFTNSITVSKLAAAEEHIKAAVRLYLEGGHLVPVFTLANAAREIVATLGEKGNLPTIQSQLAAREGITVKEMVKEVSRVAGFLKHADRNPTSLIEIHEEMVAATLQLACHDFGKVTGGMPLEAQIYEAWIITVGTRKVHDAPRWLQPKLKKLLVMMPGIRTANLAGKKALALQLLNEKGSSS